MKIHQNFSLKKYNSFGMDVSCKYFAEVKNDSEIEEVLKEQRFKDLKKLVIGGGTNILFTKDFDGLIINQTSNKISIFSEDENHVFISADAGVIWHELVLFCVNKNLGGIENLILIPGKVGAAPIQNIGAYGQELADVFHSLSGIHFHDLSKEEFNETNCEFGYRDSIFKRKLKNRFIITSVVLRLTKNPQLNTTYGPIKEKLAELNKDKFSIKDVSDIICKIRISKLPDPQKIGNAGSFFKNPEISINEFDLLKTKHNDLPGYKASEGLIKIPAAWLIEKCGFKGNKSGNVGVHEKHSLVIVNFGEGKPSEILVLKNNIIREVKLKFNIKLEEEVNII